MSRAVSMRMVDEIVLGIGVAIVGFLVGFVLYLAAMPPLPTILGGSPCMGITWGDPATVAYRTNAGYDLLTGTPVPAIDVCDRDGPGPAPETLTVAYRLDGRTVPVPVGFAIGAGGMLLVAGLIERRGAGGTTGAQRLAVSED